MRTIKSVATTSLALLFLSAGLLAQQRSVPAIRHSIEIGQNIAAVEGVLRDHRIAFSEGGIAVQRKEDTENLLCVLDKENANAVVFYSTSAKRVTGISLIFFPGRRNSAKSTQAWLPANSIRLEDDGSYVVHFCQPAKPDQNQGKREN